MGESACLFMHSSAPQDHVNALDSPQRSRHQLAFEGSVSFGRFASETLSWEKWSAFSHNRVMEEVAKYSTPGGVAQKKAYFEAHYKRVAAAKTTEQEKTVASSSPSDVDLLESVGAVGTVAAVNLSSVALGDAALDLHKEAVDVVVENAVEEQAMEVATVVEDSVDVEILPESCSTSVVIDDTFRRCDQKLNDEECSISAESGEALLHRPDQEPPLQRPDQVLIVEESSKLKKDDHIKEKWPKLSGLRSSIRRMTSKLLPSPSKLSTPTLPRQNNCGTTGVNRSPKDTIEKRKSVLRTLQTAFWGYKENLVLALLRPRKNPSR